MEKIPKQFFAAEFKDEAARLVIDCGLTLAEKKSRKDESNADKPECSMTVYCTI